MIRLTCPKCEKKLGIDDRFAGQIATCPRCKTRILVPSDEPETEESSEEIPEAKELKEVYGVEPVVEVPPAEPTPKPAKQKEDGKPAKEKENGKPVKEKEDSKLAPTDAADEEEKAAVGEAKEGDEADSKTELRVTGTLKSPMEALLSLNWLWLLLLAIGSSSLLLSMLANLVPRVAYGVFAVGMLLLIWGWIWVLVRVFNESILQGLLCFVMPPYFLYFFSAHYDDYHRPFFVTMTGLLITMMGFCGGAFRDPSEIPSTRRTAGPSQVPGLLSAVDSAGSAPTTGRGGSGNGGRALTGCSSRSSAVRASFRPGSSLSASRYNSFA
jgi:hypothetical protein